MPRLRCLVGSRVTVSRLAVSMFSQDAFQNTLDQSRLMEEGMTAAESAYALDAALAEGRRVGSAAEERQRWSGPRRSAVSARLLAVARWPSRLARRTSSSSMAPA